MESVIFADELLLVSASPYASFSPDSIASTDLLLSLGSPDAVDWSASDTSAGSDAATENVLRSGLDLVGEVVVATGGRLV
jgi:hypothetical protein